LAGVSEDEEEENKRIMKEFLDNGRFNSKNIIEDYRLIIDMVEGS
jgi:hypothetical protein